MTRFAHALLALSLAVAMVAACAGGEPSSPSLPPTPTAATTCVPAPYPTGPYGVAAGAVLEDATFDARLEDGTAAPLALHDAYTPCASAPRVLVVRVVAGFCGTCRWHAANLATIGDAATRARVRVIDVLARDDDGDAPTAADLALWQSRQDARTAVALDPTLRFVANGAPLPRVLVVDPRTMAIRTAFDDPDPDVLGDALASLVAELDGRPAPPRTPPAKIRGRWNREQWGMMKDVFLSGPPPADPTNRVGDDLDVAAFGSLLFADPLLSPSGDVSCERCHEKGRAFTDGSETATGGVGGATRNTPTIAMAAWARWQLWDGRADTLWMQALLPIEAANEFGSSRLFVAHRVYDAYEDRYETSFGPLPPLGDGARFPSAGKPGDAGFDAMPASDRDAVTKVFVDVGKSIGAFERAIRVNAIPLELYVAGFEDQLADAEKDGLAAFFSAGCAQCHWGPRLTDDAFHPIRFPTGRKDLVADDGRVGGIPLHDASEFRSDGRWSDAKITRVKPLDPAMRGAFKTPPLRGAPVTGPYGHGGSVPSLAMAIDLHRTGGMPAQSTLASGTVEPWLVPFDVALAPSLEAFLRTLSLGFTAL